MARKKVLVSGCFDMLHSGHVAFLEEAATYGELYVGIGSDRTIRELKGRDPVNSENERAYMLNALSCVKKVLINKGDGFLDFSGTIEQIRPDHFIVNEDGHSPEKEKLCRSKNIKYTVLRRIPHSNFPARSTTALRNEAAIPYRIDIAGTWIDQPYVSKYHPGAAITASIEPTIEFNERSGMATSTRNKAIELWHGHLPMEKPEKLAKILFRYDNDPGTMEVSGSQDAIGITMPGINKFYYDKGKYWPSKFETILDPAIIKWLEERVYLRTLWPRAQGFNVLAETHINRRNVMALTEAAEYAWEGLKTRSMNLFVKGFSDSFNAQVKMFPGMMSPEISRNIDLFRRRAAAWKLAGAGGGGYLILISEKEIQDSIRIKIRLSGTEL